jgi:hypothetical protein
MKLPNTIIIGAQKAGTTSLFNGIGQHPDIFAEPSMKDFPFFSDDRYFNKGLKWFSDHFKGQKNQKVIAHGAVIYIYHYDYVAKRLHDYNKDLKILLILRNPVERAYSAFWFARKMNLEAISNFDEAIKNELELSKRERREKPVLSYINRGYYYDQLAHYYKYFNKNQIKVLIFENFMDDKKGHMKEVFRFLEVDETFIPDYKKLNASGIPRFKNIDLVWKNPIFQSTFKKLLPYNLRFKLREKINKLNVKTIDYPSIDKETRSKLMAMYEDDIAKLSELLKEDLSIWK